MRVLTVIPAISAEAGAEQSMFAVTPHLLARGLEVEYAILSEHQGYVPALRALGVTVHDLSGRSILDQVRELRRIYSSRRPDLVHATLFQASLRAQLASLGTRMPILVTWANTPLDARTEGFSVWKTTIVKIADALLGRVNSTRYHAVTKGVAETKAAELRVPMERVRVAERGRDASKFHPVERAERELMRASLGLADDEIMILALGRQEPQKGYSDLLEAFDRAATNLPRARLFVAGREGTASAEIRSVLATLAQRQRVEMLGHRDDVDRLLAAADVVVCASHREGAAGALVEAMGAGVPVLSVDLDGMRGILEDGENALVVSRAGLREGIERMVSDEDLRRRLAAKARQTFLDRFTVERSVDALVAVYEWAAFR